MSTIRQWILAVVFSLSLALGGAGALSGGIDLPDAGEGGGGVQWTDWSCGILGCP